MAENYTITEVPINTVVDIQSISPQDNSLLSGFVTEGYLSPTGSNVEFSVYDLNNNLLYYEPNYNNWSTTDTGFNIENQKLTSLNINPGSDVENAGYSYGSVYALYNFLNNELGSTPQNQFFINEISSDRTELRIDSVNISNESLEVLFEDFYSRFTSSNTYDYFYLNFGENQLLIATNIYLDKSTSDYSILIKLYEPLPSTFNLKNQCFISSIVANSVAYLLDFSYDLGNIDNITSLSGPNTNLNIKGLVNNTTTLQNYQSLTQTVYTSSLDQLKSLLEEKGLEINVDYTDYSNFVFFSSAKSRLDNFYYKAKQIEDYNNEINILNTLVSTSGSNSSISLIEQYISNIITNFDGYEYYLYFESGSKAWPKTNSTPPYTLASTGSAAVLNWFGSDVYGSSYYGGQSYSASLYDDNNQNILTNTVPDYLKDYNSENYLTFVKMIGQSFDSIWVYIKSISDKSNTDNRLEYGAPSGLIADILQSFGVKLYTNNFSVDNTYESLLGIGANGQLYPTGSELINTLITASTLPLTLNDVQNLTYKRLYHNLPYLLKKKGTIDGIRTLANIFGVPDTILRINEFGGKDKNSSTWDYWQNEYNYALKSTGSYYLSSSFSLNSTWAASNNVPGAVEFRFKAESTPPTNKSQSLWTTDKGLGVFLEYTGSGLSTGSYSGSIVNPYYQYGTLKFISGTNSASVYLPFFDGGWWSVLINSGSAGYTLYAKNNIYSGNDGNTLGFQASSTLNTPTLWSGSTISYFVTSSGAYKGLSGSLQEIRYYTQPLSEDSFNAYVMNPNSIEQSQYLAFRASLGGELYTGSTSIHPKVSGVSSTTSSFTGTSNFYISSTPIYLPNTETSFYDQPAVGIQNAVSSKIQNQEVILPPTDTKQNVPVNTVLSPFRSIQQYPSISSSYTNDVNYVEVAYSPQNEINEDIMSTLGYFNIGDYIGDPRQVSSSNQSYPDLDALRNLYFEKYSSNYDWNDYLRLIKYFDNSFFKMLKDYTPAKTSLASGVVIKQHLLERNKYPTPQMHFSQSEYTASIDMYQITGSNGGALNITPIVTQSWTGVNDTVLGLVSFTHNNEDEFFNGEFSGSQVTVTDGELGYPISLTNIGSWQVGSNINVSQTTLRPIGFDFDLDQTYYIQFTYTIQAPGGTSISLQDGLGKVYYTTGTTAVSDITTDLIEVKNPFSPLGFLKSNATSICAVKDVYIYKYVIDAYDADPLLNNAQNNRLNPYYMDVDYSTSQNIPVNLQTILSGSGTRFSVPESNYTSKRSVNSRYDGSKNSGQYNYSQSYASSSIAPGYPIDSFVNYFAYFDWVGGSNPQYPGGGNTHIIYLINAETKELITLTDQNQNIDIVSRVFVKDNPVYIFPYTASIISPGFSSTIVEGGALYKTILYKSGSITGVSFTANYSSSTFSYNATFSTSSGDITDTLSSNVGWIYSLMESSSSIYGDLNISQSYYISSSSPFALFNDKLGTYITGGMTASKSDTLLPLKFGDFIRFGITSSGGPDNNFTNNSNLYAIRNIVSGVDPISPSTINLSPIITNNLVAGNQNYRIFRRIPNETFVLTSTIPYGGPGLLIPYNLDPKYNPAQIAKDLGL